MMTRLCRYVLVLAMVVAVGPGYAQDLRFADAPLSQIVELYSRATGKNVFLDETIQKNRRITAHLPNMPMERAFEVVIAILGLQSCRLEPDGIILFPPERAHLYHLAMRTTVLKTPAGVDAKWATALFNQVAPNVKVAPLPDDKQSVLLVGPEEQLRNIRTVSARFPEIAVDSRSLAMSGHEAALAVKEVRIDGVEPTADASGISWKGLPEKADQFEARLFRWRRDTGWGNAVFTPTFLTPQDVHKAAEASKGRAVVTPLGNTGSIFIEGPMADHLRLVSILRNLDEEARPRYAEVGLGEMSIDTARQAIRDSEVKIQGFGDNRLVLVGKPGTIANAAGLLETLARKKRQVNIQFRLAEVTRARLRNLGIELDKSAYTYAELKTFHPQDVLPLLLQMLDEGKHGRILAQPNVSVVEGEKAKVTIGDRIPLEVAATAQTDSGSTLKLNTQLTWVDVGIKLGVEDVRINGDDSIRMSLKTEVSSVVGYTKQGYPQIRTREAESILRVNDGGSAILGGLVSREERRQRNQVPVFSEIPLVGWLLNSNRRDSNNSEIVMIVTARLATE